MKAKTQEPFVPISLTAQFGVSMACCFCGYGYIAHSEEEDAIKRADLDAHQANCEVAKQFIADLTDQDATVRGHGKP